MGLFDFVENFFFISLGITFALILLLVYHFKQRISSMERKGDTMFELLSNVVKELQSVKGINSYYESFFQSKEVSANVCPYSPPTQKNPERTETLEGTEPLEEPEKRIIDLSLDNSCPFVPNMNVVKQLETKIVVSDDDDSDSESEYSDSEGSCLDESDSDDDTSSEYDGLEDEVIESHTGVESTPVIESHTDVESEVLESTHVIESEVVVSEVLEPLVLESSSLEPVAFEPEVQPEQVLPPEFEIEQISAIEPSTSVEEQGTSTQETNAQDTSAQTSDDAIKNQKHEVYLKMNITQLKTLAISVGIQQDISKMKKKDLIRLLESLDE